MLSNQVSAYRLSLQQRHLWMLLQDGSTFNSQYAVQLRGSVDPVLMQQAVSELIRRHDILRTRFLPFSGLKVPCQSVAAELLFEWQVRDWTDLGKPAQQLKLEQLICQEFAERFALQAGPLVRLTLARLSDDEYVLLFTLPSLCADSRTLSNIGKELCELYGCRTGHQLSDQNTLMQYVQFSDWNHDLLTQSDASVGKARWEKTYSGSLPEAPLPLMRKPEEPARFIPCVVDFHISSAVLDSASQAGADPQDFLLASLQVLLWKLTGQADLVVGQVHSGRDYQEFEAACGPFAKVLPARGYLRGELRWTELLERNRVARAEAEEWGAYFNWDSGPSGSASLSFVVEVEKWAFPGSSSNVEFSTLHQHSEIDRYKLKLRAANVAENLWKAWLHYDPEFFDSAAATQFAGYLATLMLQAAPAPDSCLKDLEILSAVARNEVLCKFNPPRIELLDSGTICESFENAAARTPDKEAVNSAFGKLTYGELNQRANQVARYLRQKGVRAEVPVVLLTERNPNTILGLLGILKAGGVYVPLDPSYPRQRIDFVLNDTAAAFVLAEKRHAELVPTNSVRICFDEDWDQISKEDSSNLSMQVDPENAAYVIYTSGSTGQPKGVVISHRNLMRSTRTRETYYPDPVKCFLLLSSFSFDSSVAGIFWSLATSATLYLPEERLQMDVSAIAETVERAEVSHLLCLPSLYSLLLKQGDVARLSPLRTVIVAGEACTRDLVAVHHRTLPGVKLYNEYGPTENTVWSTVCQIQNEHGFPTVPIGSPVAHSYLYLLDEQMNPVPFGVQGQIYVGGQGIARGYLGKPDLTAQRFLPDPYGMPSARLYSTGDIGRYRSDGQIEFLGREDNQVKIRGYRIELDEIATVLRQHPGVLDAIVTVWQDEPDDRRLVAYVVPQDHSVLLDGPGNYTLPNGMRIVHQNKNETDYLYEEIFESQSYLRHGIGLPDNATVFDVGANIGMFMLLVGERCPSARIYSFEPIPEVYRILQQNASLCSAQKVSTFQCGLADKERIEDFTYYPRSSMLSSLSIYANRSEEVEVVKRFLRNEQSGGVAEAGDLLQHAEELLEARLSAQTCACRLRRLSDVVKEERIERIHLLKIDVQRAEMDVLSGIDAEDWDKIDQIAIEAHDTLGAEDTGRVRRITELLRLHGYEVSSEQEEGLKGTDLHNIYAVRRQNRSAAAIPALEPARTKVNSRLAIPELRGMLRSKLPEFMVPSNFEMLARLPLLPNGKVDRKALPKPGQKRRTNATYAPPGSELESQLAALWVQELKIEKVGIDDNFFDLGGHSFLAIRMHHRLCQMLKQEIHLLKIFEHPTVRSLARFLEQQQKAAPDIAVSVQAENWATERRDALRRQRALHQKIS